MQNAVIQVSKMGFNSFHGHKSVSPGDIIRTLVINETNVLGHILKVYRIRFLFLKQRNPLIRAQNASDRLSTKKTSKSVHKKYVNC